MKAVLQILLLGTFTLSLWNVQVYSQSTVALTVSDQNDHFDIEQETRNLIEKIDYDVELIGFDDVTYETSQGIQIFEAVDYTRISIEGLSVSDIDSDIRLSTTQVINRFFVGLNLRKIFRDVSSYLTLRIGLMW